MNVRLIQRAAKLHGVLACAVVPDDIDLVRRHGGLQGSVLYDYINSNQCIPRGIAQLPSALE